MRVCILGPLEVWEDGRELRLGGGRQRALFAVLFLHANEVVSTDRLIEALWPEAPPATAAKVVQTWVSQMRKVLPADALVTRPTGYLLRAAESDASEFEELAFAARTQEPAQAAQTLRRALALWRGRPFADVDYEAWAQSEIGRLEDLRLATVEDRIDVELQLGMQARLVSELEALVGEHPLRERLRAQLLVALYRSGRQAEALEAYSEARRRLVDELGIEPGRELQELQRRILAQDPGLGPVDRPFLLPKAAHRAPLLRASGALLLAAATALGALELTSGSSRSVLAVTSNSVAIIDPRTNRLIGDVPVGHAPARVVAGAGAIWVLNADDRTISRIDAKTRAVSTFAAGPDPTDIAFGDGSLWVMNGYARQVLRIDPATDAVDETIGFHSPGAAGGIGSIAAGSGALWLSWTVTSGKLYGTRYVWRVDTARHRVRVFSGRAGGGPVAIGADSVWIRGEETLLRIDPRTLATTTISIPSSQNGPPGQVGEVAVGEGSAWATDTHNGVLWRVDPATDVPTRTIPVGIAPDGVAVVGGSVWVADIAGGTITRVDLASNSVVATITVGNAPRDVTSSDGLLWVSVD
jgi:YVTN family beta-propeller protein